MLNNIAWGVMLTAIVSDPISAASNQPSCSNGGKSPWVSTKDAAKAIYLAVGQAQGIPRFKDYPIILVEDGGDHWSVWQESGKPPPKLKAGQVIVQAGGGQLSMDIDKCTGAISNAVRNR
jgi:hypothetical protein